MKKLGGAPVGNKNRSKYYEGPQYAWMTKGNREFFTDLFEVEEMLAKGWRRGRLAGKAGYKGRKAKNSAV